MPQCGQSDHKVGLFRQACLFSAAFFALSAHYLCPTMSAFLSSFCCGCLGLLVHSPGTQIDWGLDCSSQYLVSLASQYLVLLASQVGWLLEQEEVETLVADCFGFHSRSIDLKQLPLLRQLARCCCRRFLSWSAGMHALQSEVVADTLVRIFFRRSPAIHPLQFEGRQLWRSVGVVPPLGLQPAKATPQKMAQKIRLCFTDLYFVGLGNEYSPVPSMLPEVPMTAMLKRLLSLTLEQAL